MLAEVTFSFVLLCVYFVCTRTVSHTETTRDMKVVVSMITIILSDGGISSGHAMLNIYRRRARMKSVKLEKSWMEMGVSLMYFSLVY